MAYQTILVAVDTTEEAGEVLAAARDAAQGGSMACITVVKPLTGIYGAVDMAAATPRYASFEQEALGAAKTALEKLAPSYGVQEKDLYVNLGVPASEIRRTAESIGADLIVIGTHGRHGLGLLLGSTANAVLHGVGCDVLVVKIQGVQS